MSILKMLASINFYNQIHCRGVKIHDVWPEWFLSVKLNPQNLLPAQSEPEQLLGIGQSPCAICVMVPSGFCGNGA